MYDENGPVATRKVHERETRTGTTWRDERDHVQITWRYVDAVSDGILSESEARKIRGAEEPELDFDRRRT
jgi:hypothetical protein